MKLTINKIVNNFRNEIICLRNKKILGEKGLVNIAESNVHSWLEYILIKSIEKEKVFAIPEVKIPFNKPFNPNDVGFPNRRLRHFRKVDVALFDNNKKLHGICEIFTKDTVHECLTTQDTEIKGLSGGQIMASDIILHLIKNTNELPKFIILIVVLLDSCLRKENESYESYKVHWNDFQKKINIENSLILINEKWDIEPITKFI